MERPLIKFMFYALLAFASFGFVYKIINDPAGILRTLGYTALFLLIIYLLFTYVLRPAQSGKQNQAYVRAAKQSKSRLRDRSQKKADIRNLKKAKRLNKLQTFKKRKETHLTVIEGKKGKKKNRAFF